MKYEHYVNKLTQEKWLSCGKIQIIEGVEFLLVCKATGMREMLMRRDILEKVKAYQLFHFVHNSAKSKLTYRFEINKSISVSRFPNQP